MRTRALIGAAVSFSLLFAGASCVDGTGDRGAAGGTGANPGPDWLSCEDFERGTGDFEAWLAGSELLESPGSGDRGGVTLASDSVHSESHALFMPAAASSGYQGASMDGYACDGETRANCPLRSFDTLFFRTSRIGC